MKIMSMKMAMANENNRNERKVMIFNNENIQ